MDKYQELLDVVDEQDRVIGRATRKEIHEKGLLHREVHVYLFNSNGDILFQKRGQDVDTFPGLLDASVGGHVELGDRYEETALKELREETGMTAVVADLIPIGKNHYYGRDVKSNKVNNNLRFMYAFRFDHDPSEIVIEQGKATGFEFWSIERLEHLTNEERASFIPRMVQPDMIEIYRRVSALAKT